MGIPTEPNNDRDAVTAALIEQVADLQTEFATFKAELVGKRWEHVFDQLELVDSHLRNIHPRLEALENDGHRRPIQTDGSVSAEGPVVEPKADARAS